MLLRDRRGLTGLETAIIVIAFVIVAAAFAFAVLEYLDYNSTDDPDGPSTGQYSVHCMATIYQIHGDDDNMLEYGEKFLVAINVTTLYRYALNDASAYPQLKPNDEFIIEVKPPVGAILTVIRRLPPALDTVMNLG